MANEILDKALEGFAGPELDFPGHKYRAYLVDLNLAGPSNGAWVVTGVTYVGATVTVTTQAAHGIAVGDRFALFRVGGVSGANGNWVAIAGTTGTTIVFTASATPTGTYTSGGFVANLSLTFLSAYAGAAARSIPSSRLTGKTRTNGVLYSTPVTWTGVVSGTGGAFGDSEAVLLVMTATTDTDGQADAADTAQRVIAHLDNLSGLTLQANPGNVTFTPDAATGWGKL
jgi:hypothetical protein